MSKRKYEESDSLDAVQKAAQAISSKISTREHNDPEFTRDIEINHLRNRYVLTKGSTQQRIKDETGASVYTRGMWYPDTSLATDKDPPLYLHITAHTAQELNKGIAAVQALMQQELGPLTEKFERTRRKWPEEKVFINLENLRNFNIRAKVVGPAGLFVKHIQQETNCKVQVKGQGSGFVDAETGRESDEPMHIAVTGPDDQMVMRAKELAEDLMVVVQQEWQKTKSMNDAQLYQQGYGGAGYAPPPPPDAYAPPLPPGGEQPPPPPGGAVASVDFEPPAHLNQTPEQQAYWAQIKANPQYAAYYKQLYAAYQQPQVSQAYSAGGYAAPAPFNAQPPPPAGNPPPPPSDRRQGAGVYGAVPPPPNL